MRQKKIIFISDAHLGSGTNEQRKEQILLDFLRGLSPERVSALYVLGDLFDFWFEYRSVIPSKHFRVLGALADTIRSGIAVHLVVGNHDFWAGDFLEKTVGIVVHKDPIEIELGGKRVYVCHGDGLNPLDRGYLLLKTLIRSGPVVWLTRLVHPDLLVWLARQFSKLSRESVSLAGQLREDDGIAQFALGKLREGYDVVIAAHSHQPHEDVHSVNGAARRYFNVGDMQERFSCLEYFDGKFQLKYLVDSGQQGI
jgi:UDP-2,3-diacylglucosamine hydrolase